MSKVTYALNNMTGGEVSPRLDGRPDVAKQRNGLKVAENFQILVHGGARKRPGTKFVTALKSGSAYAVLQPFQFSTSDSYMLIFGPSYIWVAKNRGMVTGAAVNITGITKANPGVVTAASHGFANGDSVIITGVAGMTEVNNRRFVVANATTNTFELSGVNTTSYTTYSSGGSVAEIIEIATTYSDDELQELRFAQYNDVLYITHKDHPLRKLSRVSNTSWTLEDVELTTGPFREINGDDERVMTIASRTFNVTGATRANPCVITTSTAHVFEVGDTVSFASIGGMTQLNGNAYDVTAVTSTTITISVDSSAFTAYTSGGTVAHALTDYKTFVKGTKVVLTASWGPFDALHVGALWRLSESGGGPGVPGPPLGDKDSTLNNKFVYTTNGKVYGISNYTGSRNDWKYFNRVPDHDSGTVRVIASRASGSESFDANFLHPGYCIVQITGVASSTTAYAKVVRYQVPESILSAGTSFWEEGAWSDYRGFPRCCAFFEQRLFTGGSTSEPTVLWASRTGAFENFEDGPDDDDALIYRASSGFADVIRWLSGGRVLVAGTSQGEYAIAASNQNEALTPSNLRMLLQTTYGTSDCPPIRVNEAVLYPQRFGLPTNAARKLREFTYDFTADTFNSVDTTVFAEHVTGEGFSRMAFQMQPEPLIVTVRTDGQMPLATYDRLQDVIAWQRYTLGGNGLAKSVGVSSGLAGDDVWIVVEREIDGGTERYLEVLDTPFEQHIHDKEDAMLLDAALTYSGSSASTITGLWHLRGEEVSILNNGSVETGTVSATGSLTLAKATTKAHIGYPYTAVLETEDLEGGTQAGVAQSRMKRISNVWVRLLGSLGGTAGPDAAKQSAIVYRDPDTLLGASPPLYSGLKRIEHLGGYDREASIRIEHSDPLPFHVTAIIAELNAQG